MSKNNMADARIYALSGTFNLETEMMYGNRFRKNIQILLTKIFINYNIKAWWAGGRNFCLAFDLIAITIELSDVGM
jgi:hypothetical protein